MRVLAGQPARFLRKLFTKGAAHMKLLVYKFGGTSLCDAAALRGAARQLADAAGEGFGVMAVASAQAGVTDRLIRAARELSPLPDARELDQLLTGGEQAAAALLAIAVQEGGCSAVSLTGRQAGILTDGAFGDAEIRAIHRRRILGELSRGRIVVTAGFQGTDRMGEATTLGRGGSDTTAVALAAAFGASGCRICTDVDGVYESDPHLDPAARRYDFLSYEEMLQLARAGARVLHPRAAALALRYRVPLTVMRTGAETGTVIGRRETGADCTAPPTAFLFAE